MPIAGFLRPDIPTMIRKAFTGPDRVALYLVWGTAFLSAILIYRRTEPADPGEDVRHCPPPGRSGRAPARADRPFWLSRRRFMPLYVIPLALSTVAAAYAMYSLLVMLFGPASHAGPAAACMLVAFTVAMMLGYDLLHAVRHTYLGISYGKYLNRPFVPPHVVPAVKIRSLGQTWVQRRLTYAHGFKL